MRYEVKNEDNTVRYPFHSTETEAFKAAKRLKEKTGHTHWVQRLIAWPETHQGGNND